MLIVFCSIIYLRLAEIAFCLFPNVVLVLDILINMRQPCCYCKIWQVSFAYMFLPNKNPITKFSRLNKVLKSISKNSFGEKIPCIFDTNNTYSVTFNKEDDCWKLFYFFKAQDVYTLRNGCFLANIETWSFENAVLRTCSNPVANRN